MLNPTPSYSVVRIEFNPYSHHEVQKLLSCVYKDFGRNKDRWYYVSADLDDVDKNVWVLDFKFRNPHDATLFGLKYMR